MARGTRASHDLYSPERPTAVVLSGTGADGAYHAGVLKALHDAGVKVDLVAGRGVGALSTVLWAVDGAATLWAPGGVWTRPAITRGYRFRWSYRAVGLALLISACVLVSPLLVLVAAAAVWPLALVAGFLGLDAGATLITRYTAAVAWAYAPSQFPTWVPRLVMLVMAVLAVALAARAAWGALATPRRHRGSPLWRLLGAPVDSTTVVEAATAALWDLLRGGAKLARPGAHDLSQRYTELLTAGLGQPGHRDVLLTVHDLDARRDLVFGLVGGEAGRRQFPGPAGPAGRRAEAFDLGATGKGSLVDALAGALTLPAVSEPHALRFPTDGYWRGETHRVTDRPGALTRLLEEAAAAGIEQVIVVTAAPEPAAPHDLHPPRLDGRSRVGEWLAAEETVAVREAVRFAHAHFHAVFAIRPTHNPVGPLDLGGADDARSDRRCSLDDMVARGSDDAQRLFIEPALGAAGERVGEAKW